MKIAILGFGKQGRSAYEYWKSTDNRITICDSDTTLKLPSDAKAKLGPDYLKGLERFDMIVRSPGIHPKDIEQANTPAIIERVTTGTSEFFKTCPSKNVIGVTGTKGKGTTSTLIAKMLEAAGKTVHLGGNIGTPPLDLLMETEAVRSIQPDDWVVLELANYQLIDFKYAPRIGVCLMVAPEHLDWHRNLDEYFTAKQQLFAHQKPDDLAIYYGRNEYSRDIAGASPGRIMPYYHPPGTIIENDDVIIDGTSICSTDEIKLLGRHNWQNVCAAVTVMWQISKNIDAIREVLTSFAGMEHRLELVREFGGVKYYDDSFGTTPETARVAIETFTEPKIVILGGRTKGIPFDPLGEVVAGNNVKYVIAIGETGLEIMKVLRNAGYTSVVKGEKTIQGIVRQARDLAEPGDVVLLSPACTSFDMFENYADRGEKFREAVLKLV
ncbi:MAG TPA: UDP-N-acetylmuramoyl-L-alanine--D-glutamate ligase [Candidatus Saccharimonadales bacterium]|nr:UDP-N-acetylmuramoyl-L-alanine--D-glutamate ligase [Candidatus Saccharimonadales bacterium]